MKTVAMYITILLGCAAFVLGGCNSSTGDSAIDLTPPPVPLGLDISQIGNGSVTLSWSKVDDSGLKGYYVYWLADTEMDTLKASRRFTSDNFITISDLEYERTYSFAVLSIDVSGNESALSVVRTGTPRNTTPPLPPEDVDLAAENTDTPKITIYWAENTEPDIANYKVFRSLSSSDRDSDIQPIATVTQSNYTDTDIEVGVAYYYWVKAVDKGDWESSPSSVVVDAALQKVILDTPTGYKYVGVRPTFSWQAVSGAKKYNVVVTTTRIGGEIWNVEVDASTTTATYSGKTGLTDGNTYYWKVGAISRQEINSVSEVGIFVVRNQ